jgi:hypothetical protein
MILTGENANNATAVTGTPNSNSSARRTRTRTGTSPPDQPVKTNTNTNTAFADNLVVYMVFGLCVASITSHALLSIWMAILRVVLAEQVVDKPDPAASLSDLGHDSDSTTSQENGQQPLRMESLLRLLVLTEHLNNGQEDYDGLLQFHNQGAGPTASMQELVRNMGATREEINQCPTRSVCAMDMNMATGDLLSTTHNTNSST